MKNASDTCQSSDKAPNYVVMYDALKLIISLVLVLWLPVHALVATSHTDCAHAAADSVNALGGTDFRSANCCDSVGSPRAASCDHCIACYLTTHSGIVRRADITALRPHSVLVVLRVNTGVPSHYGDPLYKPPRIV